MPTGVVYGGTGTMMGRTGATCRFMQVSTSHASDDVALKKNNTHPKTGVIADIIDH